MILTKQIEAEIRYGKWRKMIENARSVEVKATDHVEPGTVFALDCDAASMFPRLTPHDQRGRVYVICHTQHAELATSLVQQLRNDYTTHQQEHAISIALTIRQYE